MKYLELRDANFENKVVAIVLCETMSLLDILEQKFGFRNFKSQLQQNAIEELIKRKTFRSHEGVINKQ